MDTKENQGSIITDKQRILPITEVSKDQHRCGYCGQLVQLDINTQFITHPLPLCWYWETKLDIQIPTIKLGELLNKTYATTK